MFWRTGSQLNLHSIVEAEGEDESSGEGNLPPDAVAVNINVHPSSSTEALLGHALPPVAVRVAVGGAGSGAPEGAAVSRPTSTGPSPHHTPRSAAQLQQQQQQPHLPAAAAALGTRRR